MSSGSTTLNLDVERLVRDHQASLWRYLLMLGCDGALAEDILQETFLDVLRRPFNEIAPAATRAYLRQVARGLFLKAISRAGRRAALAQALDGVAPSEAALDEADDVWLELDADASTDMRRDALGPCLEAIDERGRRALDLRYGKDMNREQVGAALGLSESGAKKLMLRTLDALRDCIERRIGHERR